MTRHIPLYFQVTFAFLLFCGLWSKKELWRGARIYNEIGKMMSGAVRSLFKWLNSITTLRGTCSNRGCLLNGTSYKKKMLRRRRRKVTSFVILEKSLRNFVLRILVHCESSLLNFVQTKS
jgi:hypothetical protein